MEVEAYLMTHPDVNLAAVVGLPDARLSEVAVAFVRLEPGRHLPAAAVIDYCRGKIASFKIPRHVAFVPDFPWTGSGKIQKAKLRDEARRLFGGEGAR
jgi:acyl-coenzyme A synthetase/AMP-(fatty) acid ligase